MKKTFISILLSCSFLIGFSQLTPQQIDAYKGTASGTDTYSVTIGGSNNPSAPYDGEQIVVKFTNTNTGASTLKVNNYAVRAIQLNGAAISAGDIPAGVPLELKYVSSVPAWSLSKPGTSTGAPTNAWDKNGNTVAAEKWLGTMDNFDLPLRTNNTERLRISNAGFFTLTTTGLTATSTANITFDVTSGIDVNVTGDDKFKLKNNSNSGVATFVTSGLTVGRLFTFPNVNGTFITTGNLSSITATGTVASGVWNGTAITVPYGGTGNTAFAAGSVVFSDGTILTQDNSNFFWDNANNRLGLGMASPSSSLHVKGSGATSATFTQKILNSANANMMEIRDDGAVGIGGTSGSSAGGGGSKFIVWDGFIEGVGADNSASTSSLRLLRANNDRNFEVFNDGHVTINTANVFGVSGEKLTVYNGAIAGGLVADDTDAFLMKLIGNTAAPTQKFAVNNKGNIGLRVDAWGTNATGTFGAATGTAPTTSPADMFQMYSADVSAGNATAFIRSEGGEIISLGSEFGTQSNHALSFTTNATVNAVLGTDGNFGIGVGASPAAVLHLKAGSTTIAPLRFQTGTLTTTAVAGEMEYTTPSLYFTNGTAVRQEVVLSQQSRVSTQFDKAANTTLGNVTGLTANVAASGVYKFEAVLHIAADVVGGGKYAVAGTATATNIIYQINSINNATGGTVISDRETALGGSGEVVAGTVNYTTITGLITVNAAGTLTVQFAQSVASGTSSVLVGSTLTVTQVQ